MANGWLQRAHSLLDELEPGPDHGWLAVHEASMLVGEDTATARRLARGAVEMGRRFGVPELEMVGLALGQLSQREREVLALVAEGLTNQQIAGRLVLSDHTVHRHVTNILRKLRLPSRAAAASLAGRHRLA